MPRLPGYGRERQPLSGLREGAPPGGPEAALLAGGDPNLGHGTLSAYRNSGCWCPDCREAKARSGAWIRLRSTGRPQGPWPRLAGFSPAGDRRQTRRLLASRWSVYVPSAVGVAAGTASSVSACT
ncbi:hypothetical protein ACH4MA_04090 [Streptomyces roseolus]|uniref:hypothetical protein n=1 Tax=Streptomyces roseolus TaxID=67358 RepID=UPI0037A44120